MIAEYALGTPTVNCRQECTASTALRIQKVGAIKNACALVTLRIRYFPFSVIFPLFLLSVMESGLHAFRIALCSRGKNVRAVEAGTEVHHTRRAHNKSRGGCEGCKQRRKKVYPWYHSGTESKANMSSVTKKGPSARSASNVPYHAIM